MDPASFAPALLGVALPVLAVFSLAAWLAGRGVRRVRLASRDGRILAQIVLSASPGPIARPENPARTAFRP
jgi:hypothetical protein